MTQTTIIQTRLPSVSRISFPVSACFHLSQLPESKANSRALSLLALQASDLTPHHTFEPYNYHQTSVSTMESYQQQSIITIIACLNI